MVSDRETERMIRGLWVGDEWLAEGDRYPAGANAVVRKTAIRMGTALFKGLTLSSQGEGRLI